MRMLFPWALHVSFLSVTAFGEADSERLNAVIMATQWTTPPDLNLILITFALKKTPETLQYAPSHTAE